MPLGLYNRATRLCIGSFDHKSRQLNSRPRRPKLYRSMGALSNSIGKLGSTAGPVHGARAKMCLWSVPLHVAAETSETANGQGARTHVKLYNYLNP